MAQDGNKQVPVFAERGVSCNVNCDFIAILAHCKVAQMLNIAQLEHGQDWKEQHSTDSTDNSTASNCARGTQGGMVLKR